MHTYMYIQCIDDELCSSQANIAEENQHYCKISLRHVSLHPDDHTWSKCTSIRKSWFEDDNMQHVLYPRSLS